MPLRQLTKPAIEPITVAEAKRQMRRGRTDGEPAPTAPTVALVSPPAPGLCDDGQWRIGWTCVTPDGVC